MDAVRDKGLEAFIEEASQWVVRMTAPDVSAEDKRAFIRWLKRSPVHLGEYLRVERTWADLGAVDSARSVDVAALFASADDNVVELNPRTAPPPGAASAGSRLATGIAGMLAACFALALVGIFWFQVEFANRYATGVGEQRTLKLSDGSTIVLNTDTRVRIAFSDTRREVPARRRGALQRCQGSAPAVSRAERSRDRAVLCRSPRSVAAGPRGSAVASRQRPYGPARGAAACRGCRVRGR